MANYIRHMLHLYGPTTTLAKLVAGADVESPQRLVPTAKPKPIPPLSSHTLMEWHSNNAAMMAELRAHLNRPDPYPVLDWEARCFLTNTPFPMPLSLDADFDTTLPMTLSVTALFFGTMPWLASSFPANGATGLPKTLKSAGFLKRLPANGSHIAKAKFTSFGKSGYLEVDFGWHRKVIPPSAGATILFKNDDLPDIYAVDCIVDDASFEEEYSAKKPGDRLKEPKKHPEYKGSRYVDGVELTHTWDHWQNLAHHGVPEHFLRCIFKTKKHTLEADYHATQKDSTPS